MSTVRHSDSEMCWRRESLRKRTPHLATGDFLPARPPVLLLAASGWLLASELGLAERRHLERQQVRLSSAGSATFREPPSMQPNRHMQRIIFVIYDR